MDKFVSYTNQKDILIVQDSTATTAMHRNNKNNLKLCRFMVAGIVAATTMMIFYNYHHPNYPFTTNNNNNVNRQLFKSSWQHRREQAMDPKTIQFKVPSLSFQEQQDTNPTNNLANTLQCVNSHVPLQEDDYTIFHGHTIYMIGDSLMRDQFQHLCMDFKGIPLTQKNKWNVKIHVPPINPNGKFSDYIRLCESTKYDVRVVLFNRPLYPDLKHIQFIQQELETYYSSQPQYKNNNANTQPQQILPNVKPSIIYFNAGFHLLHLHPHQAYNSWKIAQDIEHYMVSFVQDANGHYPNTHLVFMKSHSICEDHYINEWADAVHTFHQNPLVFAQPCVEYLRNQSYKLDGTVLPRDHAIQTCLDTSFTNHGSNRMNQRIEQALSYAMQRFQTSVVGCVDGYEITRDQCQDTVLADGRHYKKRTPHELKSLAIVIVQQQQQQQQYLQNNASR